ncbi:MAG TPA: cellulase-like family protein, partial [Deinococcales bacterium]|nr:cellulase-like family protein [Deinococcales bacterium]
MAFQLQHPLAITMWDFSWLERRWPGAGQEDWDRSLDELQARGYDAVRLDAYPHLMAVDPGKTWQLIPEWSVQDWGAPAVTRVQVWPALPEFLRKLRERGMKAGLSTWFREDVDRTRMALKGAPDFVRIWSSVLERLEAEGLLDVLLYVDLCNEFPIEPWAPFLHTGGPYLRN